MSRADLARASGLTPTTVSNVIGELVDEGMIEEAGRTLSGSVGKPATLVSVVADARHVLCLDLSNPGEVPVTGVLLRDKLPPEVRFQSSTEGGKPGEASAAGAAQPAPGTAPAPAQDKSTVATQ